MLVRPLSAPRSAARILASVCASTALKASSSTNTGGSCASARAIAVRCFCPPERLMPRSPSMVSNPSGSDGSASAS